MKILSSTFALAVLGLTANAQQAAPVQMECHDLASSNNYVGPDETLVNGMVCHVVKQAKAPASSPQAASAAPQETKAAPALAKDPVAQPAAAPVPPPPGPISTKIVSGARVYITPMEGFESYLAAAFNKKKVPLIAVGDPAFADYVISGTSQDKKAGWAKIVFMGNVHSDNSASVTMTDKKTGAIVFAYAVDKKSTLHGQQTTAEACAKHLKNKIEDDSKH
jgi:hypothetical protein